MMSRFSHESNRTVPAQWLRMLLLGFCLMTVFSFCYGSGTGNEKTGQTEFVVNGHKVVDGLLTFDYHAPYPGVTKVLLFDKDGNLLWRGQYNDPAGKNEVTFRASNLNSGESYVFRFEYKLTSVLQTVSLP